MKRKRAKNLKQGIFLAKNSKQSVDLQLSNKAT